MNEDDYDWRMTHALFWGIVGIILCLCLCFGCTRHVYMPVVHEMLDSVSVHDTIMQMQLVPYRDSVAVRDTSSFLSNAYGYSWAVWSGGVLHHSLIIWPKKPIEITVPQVIEKWHFEKVPDIVEVQKPMSKWQQFFYHMGIIATTSIIIFAMIYAIRRFRI